MLRSNIDLGIGSLTDSTNPMPTEIPNVSFDPFKERLKDYDEAWDWLGRITIEYNWKYRKKICTKCPLQTQQRLNCHRVDNYRIIDGVKIQETHCKKLERARASKLRKHVKHVFALDPLTKC